MPVRRPSWRAPARAPPVGTWTPRAPTWPICSVGPAPPWSRSSARPWPAEPGSLRVRSGRASGTMVGMDTSAVSLRQVVLDCTDARSLAEFYRQLLAFDYRPGDEPPPAGQADPAGADWLGVCPRAGGLNVAFQQIADLPEPTWPDGPRPQMAHLDLTVATVDALNAEHGRVLELGARLLRDRSDDAEEPLRVYADPA